MSDIFLSYAREDLGRVRPLAKALEVAGWSVFWDRTIPPGKTWHELIEAELAAASVVVVAWSAVANVSEWVREEAAEGRKRRILVPLRLDDLEAPLGFRALQAADFVGWQGNTDAEGFKQLIDAITAIAKPDHTAEHESANRTETRHREQRRTSPRLLAKLGMTISALGAMTLIGVVVQWGLSHTTPAPPSASVPEAVPTAVTAVPTPSTPAPTPTPTKPISAPVPEMVAIPAGEFMMGSDQRDKDAENDESPRHAVSVRAFKLGKTETTRGQFAAFVKDTGHTATGCYSWTGKEWKEDSSKTWAAPGFDQDDTHPVVCVSFEDAQAYARWLSDKTGERYRLPTEAEWEYAARAGTETIRYWGDDANEACRYGNVADQATKKGFPDNWTRHECSDGYAYTAPVGYFRPNEFRLNDMLGNVWEWTCSSYTDTYNGSEQRCRSAGKRVIRGGSWYNEPWFVRSASRLRDSPDFRSSNIGFRLAQDN